MTALSTDIGIQKDIRDELETDPEVNVTDIGVEIDHGVVTLDGTVTNYAEKVAAERAALRVTGVRGVANALVVRADIVGQITDTEIVRCIVDAFAINSAIPADVTVGVEGRRVTLFGTVPWHYQREEAERVARQVLGVQAVLNQVRIAPLDVSPKDVGATITRSLVRNAAVDAHQIEIKTIEGQVILAGTVRSWAERQEAEDAAWRVRGVTEVTNNIGIQPFIPRDGDDPRT